MTQKIPVGTVGMMAAQMMGAIDRDTLEDILLRGNFRSYDPHDRRTQREVSLGVVAKLACDLALSVETEFENRLEK